MGVQIHEVEREPSFVDVELEEDIKEFESKLRQESSEPVKPVRKRRRVLLIGVAVFVLAAACIAVGLGVGLSQSSSNDDNNSSQTRPIEDTKPTSDFEFSKSELDELCSDSSLSEGDEAVEVCEVACEPAKCCNPFTADESCLQEETESCLAYAKCQAVLETNDIPPARTDLAQVCSLESIEQDEGECMAACKEVQCCYTEEGNCAAENFLTCLDYAPCQNLRNDTYSGLTLAMDVAPENLLDICSPVSPGYDKDKCEEMCEPGACCLADAVVAGEGCVQDNFLSCLTYAPCGLLSIPELNKVVDPAPSDLAETCSLDKVLKTGRSDCVDACEPSGCCHDTSDNCFLQDPLGCMQYAPCGVLPLTSGDVPPAPKDLEETCSMENVASGGETLANCLEDCELSLCCDVLDGPDSCFAENFFTCTQYWPCVKVYGAGEATVDSPPSDLKDICSSDRDECADLCKDAECCFATGKDNCLLGGNQHVCSEWLKGGCWRVPGFIG